MEPSSVQGGAGGCSMNDVVGEVRVSEGNEPVIGINLGLNDEVSRLDFKVDESCRRNLDELSGDRYVESNVMGDDKEEKVVVSNHIGDDSNAINLVVDLNLCRVADGDRKPQNGIGNKESQVRKFSGDLADNVDCINGDDLNQDKLIKEEATYKKDVNFADVKPECCGNECRIEKEGEFYGSDLVWAKVRSHPWWPGQIFDPSDASEKAMKHFKKDSFLIAYFGDQSFAWNDAARIKPFRMYFSQMGKQSSTESFCHAASCALDEVSRRVEFGLACSCLSEDVYAKIKSQVVVNAGIREESSRRDGGDSFSSAHSFISLKLVQYLKAVAKAPLSGTDQLEFVIAKSQLLSYNRWKGYYQLPTLEVLDGLPENDDDVPVSGKAKGPDEVIEYAVPASEGYEQVSSGKGKPIIRDSSSRKRKDIYEDGLCLRKKEKRMSDLLSESCSSLPNGENKSEAKVARKMNSSGYKRKAVDFVSNDSRVKTRKSQLSSATVSKMPPSPPRKLFRVGERIHRVASQLSGSTPILKHGDKMPQKTVHKNCGKSTGFSLPITEKSQGEKVIPTEYPPADEILSQLCLIARDPMEGYDFLNSIVCFFSSFRNSFLQECCDSRRDKKSNGNVSDKLRGKNSSNSETTETFEFEGMEDSYWTDRIIQGNPEEQVLFEPEVAIDPNLETADVNLEPESENPVGHLDEKFKEYSPTALILNFTDLDSVPSETNLNKIFSRYGPLNELETEVLKKSNRAKVVFMRRLDAETAFSSAGKFSIFGPSLVSYRLNYSPTPRKASTPAKRNRKDTTTSGKSIQFED